jgi:hypothetical protein
LIISRTDLVTDGNLIARLAHSLASRIAKWHSRPKQKIVNAVEPRRARHRPRRGS